MCATGAFEAGLMSSDACGCGSLLYALTVAAQTFLGEVLLACLEVLHDIQASSGRHCPCLMYSLVAAALICQLCGYMH